MNKFNRLTKFSLRSFTSKVMRVPSNKMIMLNTRLPLQYTLNYSFRTFGDHSHGHGHGGDHHDHHGHGEGEPFLDVKIVTERVIEVVKSFEKVNEERVTAESRFKEDLDLDSLDAVEICLQLEEEFSIQIPDSEADNILSVADAIKYISNHPMAR